MQVTAIPSTGKKSPLLSRLGHVESGNSNTSSVRIPVLYYDEFLTGTIFDPVAPNQNFVSVAYSLEVEESFSVWLEKWLAASRKYTRCFFWFDPDRDCPQVGYPDRLLKRILQVLGLPVELE
jgi:hypothetical protein